MGLPRVIKDENDPKVLRAFLSYTVDLINKQQKTIETLKTGKAAKDQETLGLDDALLLMRKRMFGKSSEKRSGSRNRGSQKKLSIHSESMVPSPTEEEMGSLPEIKVDHELTPEELSKIAKEYGYPEDAEWECIEGLFDESTEVDIKVESYVRKKHRRFKCRLKCTKGTEKEVIVTAANAVKIVSGAKYSIDLSVDVAVKKFLYHLPYERIRRMMEAGGLVVSTEVLYGLVFFVHCYIEDIAKRIREEILTCGLSLHLDETPWPITIKGQSNGYMWVMSNQAGSFYQFEPTRSGAIAKELVGSYRGPVVTDGCVGYKSSLGKNEDLILAFCWAHGRRKFTDIEENYPGPCSEILDLIDELFRLEREASSYEELAKIRNEKFKGVVDEIMDWLVENRSKARGESHLEKRQSTICSITGRD